MKLSQLRITRIIAIILILLAGFLWARRLSADTLERSISAINDSLAEQTAILETKVALKSDSVELIGLGRKLLESGSPAFAIIPLEKAVSLDPGVRDGWYLLGYAYIERANQLTAIDRGKERSELLAKARNTLKRAHTLDPNHGPTNELLGQLE